MPLINNPAGIRVIKHQQTVASDVWTIYHNLENVPALEAQVWDAGVLKKAFPVSVDFPSSNVVVLNWSVPRTGFATLA